MTSTTLAPTESTAAASAAKPKHKIAAAIGLSVSDYLTLLLIGLVVMLVSLPRLRHFALRENELDAVAMLNALGEDMSEYSEALPDGGVAALLAANSRHEDRFEDIEVLPDMRLRRHGYLFDAVEPQPGQWVLRAWPWEQGRTGLGAFVYTPAHGLLGHANPDAQFEGEQSPPAVLPALSRGQGWTSLAR
ncbi:MAG: hypothetical protein ACKO32_10340 [Planctomycetia bacterium]